MIIRYPDRLAGIRKHSEEKQTKQGVLQSILQHSLLFYYPRSDAESEP